MFNKVHHYKFAQQLNSCCEHERFNSFNKCKDIFREPRCVVYGQQHDVNRYRQEKNEIDLNPDDVEEPNLLILMNERKKGVF